MIRPAQLLFIAFVAAFAFACGDDADSKSATNNATTNNATTNNATTNNATTPDFDFCEDVGVAPWSERYSLRMNSMVFNADTAGFKLNQLLDDGFNQDQNYPIVVLLDIRGLEAAAGTFELRGGAGLKTDATGEYEWDPDAEDIYYDGTFDENCGAMNATVDRFEFIATFESEQGVEKVVLPVNELEIEAAIGREGEVPYIEQGLVRGFITKEEADNTMIVLTPGSEGLPLTLVLGEANLDYDTATGERQPEGMRGSANADAWYLEATFTAVDTTIID